MEEQTIINIVFGVVLLILLVQIQKIRNRSMENMADIVPLTNQGLDNIIKLSNDYAGGKLLASGTDNTFRFGSKNNWIIHAPQDGRKSLHIAPNGGDWGKQLALYGDGSVEVYGKLIVNGDIEARNNLGVKYGIASDSLKFRSATGNDITTTGAITSKYQVNAPELNKR